MKTTCLSSDRIWIMKIAYQSRIFLTQIKQSSSNKVIGLITLLFSIFESMIVSGFFSCSGETPYKWHSMISICAKLNWNWHTHTTNSSFKNWFLLGEFKVQTYYQIIYTRLNLMPETWQSAALNLIFSTVGIT